MDKSRKRNRPTQGYGCIFQALSRYNAAKALVMSLNTRGKNEQGTERKTLERDAQYKGREEKERDLVGRYTYHGVNMSNHLVWRDFTVLLQELPCMGDIFLDLFVVPRGELGVTVL